MGRWIRRAACLLILTLPGLCALGQEATSRQSGAVNAPNRPNSPIPPDLKEMVGWFVDMALDNANAASFGTGPDSGMLDVGVLQIRAGDWDGAKQTLSRMPKGAAQQELAGRIVAHFPPPKRSKAAIDDRARELKVYESEYFYLGLADGLAQTGDSAGANAALLAMGPDAIVYQRQGSVRVARATRKPADVAAARKWLSSKPGIPVTPSAADQIIFAEAQALAGDVNGAKAFADNIKGAFDRPDAFYHIVRAQVALGDISGAMATVKLIDPHNGINYYDAALLQVAAAQAHKGDVAAVKATAALIHTSYSSDKASALLAYAVARSGGLEAAKSITSGLFAENKIDEACFASALIAATQVEKSDIAGAKATLANAQDKLKAAAPGLQKAGGSTAILAAFIDGPFAIRSGVVEH